MPAVGICRIAASIACAGSEIRDLSVRTRRVAIITFNVRGLVMCIVAFAIAFAIGKVAGFSNEGPLMIVAGPLSAVGDLGYRFNAGHGQWFAPNGGGNILGIPVWCLGILWLILGIVYTAQGPGA
jgi:hypothetical protein